MDFTLRQLRYFVAVAEELSFTRAAERLHISQPALSVQIRQLERGLDVELFRRTSRTVQLTDAGRGLHEDLRRILAELERAGRRARRTHEGPQSRLNVVYTASVAYEALPLILDELAAAENRIEVTTSKGWCTQAVDAVLAGAADLALVREFGGAEGLDTELLRREPLAAFMSAEHSLAALPGLTADALRDQTILAVPKSLAAGFHGVASRLCERHGFSPRMVELANPESREPLLAHLRRHPDQLFLGPESMASLSWDGVVHMPVLEPDAHIGLSVVSPAGEASPVQTRALAAMRRVAAREDWLEDVAAPPPGAEATVSPRRADGR